MKKIITAAFICSTFLQALAPAANAQQTSQLQDLLQGKTYGNILAPQDYSYPDGGVALKKGEPIADGLSLSAVGFSNLTPAKALELAGFKGDLKTILADELEFLKQIPLKDLLLADPTLQDIKAKTISWIGQGERTLAEVAKTVAGDKPLPEAVLKAAVVLNK